MKFELKYVEKLINLIEKHNLTEISLNDGEKSVSIKKDAASNSDVIAQNVQTIQSENFTKELETENFAKLETEGKAIVSPMVGTFYKSPGTGEKPFVELGDSVAVGQVVCIVEAMKLMNEIEAEVSGRITKICVEDGQPVEYGQVLMYVE